MKSGAWGHSRGARNCLYTQQICRPMDWGIMAQFDLIGTWSVLLIDRMLHLSAAPHSLRGIREKVNPPLFGLWIAVTIVLRNPLEFLHPVPKHVFQGRSRDGPDDFMNCPNNSSHDGKAILYRKCLICPKRKKSDGARSDEYDWCTARRSRFSSQKVRHFRAAWSLALSA
jgi:hypothetical protein